MLVQAPVLQKDGLQFRDLNRNGVLDRYEDWRLSPEQRARDLVARMTLEEKAGTMMHGTARAVGGPMASAGMGGQYATAAVRALIDSVKVTNLITRLNTDPRTLATQNNVLQAIAERTRLGIPVTISTDPRNHFQYLPGVSTQTSFSQWPEALGFAAIDDTALTRAFGDIARQEYRAVGIHMALSPQADLATEPRWPRVAGTFGEDADLAGRQVRAYVIGFQHGANGVDSTGVVTVVKHWVGYGAAKDGWDSHTYYGRFATFPGHNLDYHIRPFLGAFAAHAAGVMPTYSILEGASWDGRPVELVGAGFNRQLLTDMLRGRYGFRGVVVTDWAITWDCPDRCKNGAPAGERPSFADVGIDAQRRALVLLENKGNLLPLHSSRPLRVYLRGVSADAATREGWTIVTDPKQADIAIVRLSAPFERLHPQYVFGQFFHEGSLAFKDGDPDYEAFKQASAAVPTIVTVYLERPAILTPLKERASALIANFGVSDAALLDVLTGRAKPEGKLPFELPSSMEAVQAQHSDVPHDSARPLYPFGFGKSY